MTLSSARKRIGLAALIMQLCVVGAGLFLAVLALSPRQAAASLVTAEYAWLGTAGWRADGTLRYDDAVAVPSARGAGFGGLVVGIDYLDFAIYDQTGLQRGAWVQVLDGVALYNTLRVTLNPSAMLFTGNLDMGNGNGTARAHFLQGTLGTGAGAGTVLAWNRAVADRGNGTLPFAIAEDPAPVSAPGSLTLTLIGGLAMIGGVRARARLHPR